MVVLVHKITRVTLPSSLCCCRYGLNVHYLKNPDFKAGLEDYLEEARTAAIVLGTRRWVQLHAMSVTYKHASYIELPICATRAGSNSIDWLAMHSDLQCG